MLLAAKLFVQFNWNSRKRIFKMTNKSFISKFITYNLCCFKLSLISFLQISSFLNDLISTMESSVTFVIAVAPECNCHLGKEYSSFKIGHIQIMNLINSQWNKLCNKIFLFPRTNEDNKENYLVTNWRMLDGCDCSWCATINPTLAKVPQWWDDQVVSPTWRESILSTAGLQLDIITSQLNPGIFVSST